MGELVPRDVIEQKIEELIDEHSEPDGSVETGACSLVEDELAEFIRGMAPPRNWRAEARECLNRFRKNRRHRRKPGQERLFEPEALYTLSTEETRVIKQAKARREHLLLHLQVRTEAHLREQDDYTEDIRFLNGRIRKFKNETETQIEVEKRDFGWSE